jgi:hypothetical protein
MRSPARLEWRAVTFLSSFHFSFSNSKSIAMINQNQPLSTIQINRVENDADNPHIDPHVEHSAEKLAQIEDEAHHVLNDVYVATEEAATVGEPKTEADLALERALATAPSVFPDLPDDEKSALDGLARQYVGNDGQVQEDRIRAEHGDGSNAQKILSLAARYEARSLRRAAADLQPAPGGFQVLPLVPQGMPAAPQGLPGQPLFTSPIFPASPAAVAADVAATVGGGAASAVGVALAAPALLRLPYGLAAVSGVSLVLGLAGPVAALGGALLVVQVLRNRCGVASC